MSSLPPNQWNPETESKSSNNKILAKCKLCKVERKNFLCRSCVKIGNFGLENNSNDDSER